MRFITSLILLTGLSETAMAHTGDGPLIVALSHQLFGLHHVPFILLVGIVAVHLIRRRYRGKRTP